MRQHLPKSVIVLASCALAVVCVPLIGIVVRVPWSQVVSTVTQPEVRTVIWTSVYTSLIAMIMCTVIGVPLAWVLARSHSRATSIVRTLTTIPMVLPPVVGGIALLATLGRRGVIGQYLYEYFDVSLPFTRTALVIAQTFVALPFLVLTVDSAFQQLDVAYEETALTLGSRPLRTFLSVAVPTILPAIGSGMVLAWARALGEFGATITFAGSFPGTTQTLPMKIYSQLEQDWQGSLVLSLVMIAVAVVVIGFVRGFRSGEGHR